MKKNAEYELLDCGGGRKLERFGEIVLDRPSPAAELVKKKDPELWHGKNAIFFRNKNRPSAWYSAGGSLPESWTIEISGIKALLKPAVNGQIGIFPEQIDNWLELKKTIRYARSDLKILNVFGYTGIATMFASSASNDEYKVEVTHVDASKSAVNWAKENAALNGLEGNPVRWIVDDAVSFMEKEIRRERKYDGIILDPPAFGRTKTGKMWSLKKDLPSLFDLVSGLMSDDPLFILISCHDRETTHEDLAKELKTMKFAGNGTINCNELQLKSKKGAVLDSGFYALWSKK